MRGAAVLLLLLLLVQASVADYEWRAVALGPSIAQISTITWTSPAMGENDTEPPLATATGNTYTRTLANFRAVGPQGYAASVDKTTNTIFTASSTATGWRVCAWKGNGGDETPQCSAQIATLADGVPTCMVYLGDLDDVLLVVFPIAGKIVWLRGRGLTVASQAWASLSGMPVHLAVDETRSIVYVALLNSNRIVRYDFSGTPLDADDNPWLLVPRPRFVLINKLANGDSTFYVMSLDADEPELHLFDALGNSLGSISDPVGQWVCDEPGGPAPAPGSEYIPRVISIGVDNGVIYALKNNHHAQVDEYSFYTGLPREVAHPLFVKDGVALVPNLAEGLATPSALVDSYSVTNEEGKYIFLECSGGGNTLDNILGVWPCGNSANTIAYDNQNIYLIDSRGCFVSYVYHCVGGCVHDTFLSGDTLYVLKKDGKTERLDNVCAGDYGLGVALANATLDPATLSVLGTDYFIFDGTPCLSTSKELLCAGSERIEIEGNDNPVTYIIASKSVMVVPSVSGPGVTFLRLQTVSLETGEQTGRWLASPSPNLGKLLVDRNSGQWGLLDTVTGQLYEYNGELDDDNALELVSGNLSTTSTASLTGWVLRDSIGPAIRYPAPATTAPPPATTRPPKESHSVKIALFIGIGIVVCICLCCVVVCVTYARRTDGKLWAMRSTGSTAQGIAPAVTYGSAEAGGAAADPVGGYWLSARTRYWLREIFCACSFCYSPATQRLRCCSSILGGRRGPERQCCPCLGSRRKQPYAQFVDSGDPSLLGEGQEMPDLGATNGSDETEPVAAAQGGDRVMGDSGVLANVAL